MGATATAAVAAVVCVATFQHIGTMPRGGETNLGGHAMAVQGTYALDETTLRLHSHLDATRSIRVLSSTAEFSADHDGAAAPDVASALEAVRSWRAKGPAADTKGDGDEEAHPRGLRYAESVSIELAPGTHFLSPGQPLTLTNEDSYTYLVAEDASQPTWLSGGAHLAADRWRFSANHSTPDRPAYTTSLNGLVDGTVDVLKSIRIGDDMLGPLRYPVPDASSTYGDGALSDNPGAAYTTGLLFVNETVYSEVNDYSYFFISINNEEDLPSWLTDPAWPGGWMSLLPDVVWLNYNAPVRPATSDEWLFYNLSSVGSETVLRVTCPSLAYHACHSSSTKALAGNAFWIWGAGASRSIDEATAERHWWVHEPLTNDLVVWPATMSGTGNASGSVETTLDSVVVPTMRRILQISGDLSVGSTPASDADFATDIRVDGIGFTDNHYVASGFQGSFDVWDTSEGIPHDAALRISGAADVAVTGCSFVNLAGAGVSIGNGSQLVSVVDSEFRWIGQSAVMVLGNSTNQPIDITVANNVINHVGVYLYSAAGIFASTTSHSNISSNEIRYSTRWGIAVRSEEATRSASRHNVIDRNKIQHTALSTSDMGAISVIAYEVPPDANTSITNNCVRDVIGLKASSDGSIVSPYNARGLYLDNYASGYYVSGNVFRDATTTGAFIHWGVNNTITNNVFFNNTNLGESGNGQFSYAHVETPVNSSAANVFSRNVIAYYNLSYAAASWTSAAVGCPSWGECSDKHAFEEFDSNLYYMYDADERAWGNLADATPVGTFAEWRKKMKYDKSSIYADPGFEAGGLCVSKDSPARTLLDFEPLEAVACEC